jgi:hypothetical protein
VRYSLDCVALKGLLWVKRSEAKPIERMTANGASRPLPSAPTKVRLLNRLPMLNLGDGDYSACPLTNLANRIKEAGSGSTFRLTPKSWIKSRSVFAHRPA